MILGLTNLKIDRPTDLKSLCLTSADFRELATPILYKTMILFVGGPQDLRLSAMLAPGNPGIRHIREVYLRLGNTSVFPPSPGVSLSTKPRIRTEKAVITEKTRRYHSDDSSEDEEIEENVIIPARQAQFTVRLLLDFLPANQLEIFSWQTWENFTVGNFILLCKKQKRLTQLEIGPMEQLLDPLLEAQPAIFDGLTELVSIDIYPESLDRLKAGQKLLKAKPKVETLCVSAGFEYNQESDIPPDLQDLSTRPGLLTRTLFSHLMPFGSIERLNLTALDLDTIDLRVSLMQKSFHRQYRASLFQPITHR